MKGTEKVRVKVCGITRPEDALLAVSLGASALGFIFYPGSPRYLSPEKAREIVRGLPPFVTTVGVFVNEEPERIEEVALGVGLDLIQLHGQEPPEVCARFFPRVIKALRLKGPEDLETIRAYRGVVRAILLEPYVEGVPGGTGRTLDWDLAARVGTLGVPIILAGGLGPGNVREAVRKVRPFAVDVNSGVEKRPGEKDPEKLRALFAALEGF